MIIRPRNWSSFQHYKNRNPAWIKLHKRLLDDFEFQSLPVASKALAPMLWLLASETVDGAFDAEESKLAFRLRITPREMCNALKPLLDKGLFELASNALAQCYPLASLEREKETEKNIEVTSVTSHPKSPSGDFGAFWLSCPRKIGKGAARKAYNRAITKTAPETIQGAIQRYATSRAGEDDQFTVHPATWLNQERWTDQIATTNGDCNGRSKPKTAHDKFFSAAESLVRAQLEQDGTGRSDDAANEAGRFLLSP